MLTFRRDIPSIDGAYNLANSKELRMRVPEKQFEKNIALDRIRRSGSEVGSFAVRSRIAFRVQCFRSTRPVLLCLLAGRGSNWTFRVLRNVRICLQLSSSSADREFGAPWRLNYSLLSTRDVGGFDIGHSLCLKVHGYRAYHMEDSVLSASDGAEGEVDLYVLVKCLVHMRE